MNLLRKYIFALFLPALFFTGCGVWEDFTTYFNLYYNTTDTFEEAEKAIFEQERDLFSTQELEVPGSAAQLLNKVVEKSSKILQFHPNSSYVDDAILIIGKAFYYQKNYQKALRKFQELIATQSESDLNLETQLWIGKTQMRLKESEEALVTLQAVLDSSLIEGEENIVKEAFVEIIVYNISIENYADAINTSKRFLEAADNDEMKAEIAYQLGKLYLEIDDIENAIASFREVNEYSPLYQIEVHANIELAKALREAGKSEEALVILEEMGDENKYLDDYSEIDLETGLTLAALGRYDEALELLTYVDTSYSTTKFSGIAKFKIGELYEYQFKNFDSASVYYGKSVGGATLPEIIISANAKIQRFKKYQALLATFTENELKLKYVLNPDLFTQDSIAYYDSLKEAQELAQAEREFGEMRENLEQSILESQNALIDSLALKDSLARIDSLARLDSLARIDSLGGVNNLLTNNSLFENNSLNQVQDTASIRNTRRPPQRGASQQQEAANVIDKKAPVRPNISADSIKNILTKTKFEMANLFFTEFNLPDSAYYYYRSIVDSFPGSPYYARSLYGLGSYYESVGENAKADSIFNIIYDKYKDEQIVNAAASKLNKPTIDLKYDPAKNLYTEAEKLMLDERYNESLEKFMGIYNDYPASDYAPKALYAGGWILENEMELFDSAAVVYDSVLSKYPQTEYASAVKSKVQFYLEDRAQKRKLLEDSLKALKAASDSLIADSLGLDSLQIDSLRTDLPDEQSVETDSSDTSPQGLIKPPVQTPVDDAEIRRKQIQDDSVNVQRDSLEQQHKTIVDSLRRRPGTAEELQDQLEEKIDSLNPGRIIKE